MGALEGTPVPAIPDALFASYVTSTDGKSSISINVGDDFYVKTKLVADFTQIDASADEVLDFNTRIEWDNDGKLAGAAQQKSTHQYLFDGTNKYYGGKINGLGTGGILSVYSGRAANGKGAGLVSNWNPSRTFYDPGFDPVMGEYTTGKVNFATSVNLSALGNQDTGTVTTYSFEKFTALSAGVVTFNGAKNFTNIECNTVCYYNVDANTYPTATADFTVTITAVAPTSFYWDSGAGSWDTSEAWTPDGVPDVTAIATYVTIDNSISGSASVVQGSASERSINTLTIGDATASGTSNLNLDGSSGLLSVSGKTELRHGATLSIFGAGRFTTGDLSLSASTSLLKIAGGIINLSSATENAQNYGTIELSFGSSLVTPTSYEMDNQGNIRIFSSTLDGDVSSSGSGTLNFAGASRITGGSVILGAVDTGATGDTVEIRSGVVTFGSALSSEDVLKGSGTFIGAGTIDTTNALFLPGSSPEVVDIGADWLMGDVVIEIMGPNPGLNPADDPLLGFDQLNVLDGAMLSLNGLLDIDLNLPTYDPSVGTTFDIITTQGSGMLDLSGFDLAAFELALASEIFNGKSLSVEEANSSGFSLIVTTAVPEPGTYLMLSLLLPVIGHRAQQRQKNAAA